MEKLKYLLHLALLLYISEVWPYAETIILPSEAPTNAAPFTVTLTGCEGFSPYDFEVIGTEVEEGVIDLYVLADQVGVSVGDCYHLDVEIGPVASGNYSINYLITGRTDLFTLAASESIEISKTSEQEPVLGRVTISGEAVENQLLTASHNLSDRNGMGDIHYQWYRNDQPVPGAVNETYLLTDDDVYRTIKVEASYVDGLGRTERVSSLDIGAPYTRITNVNDALVGSVFIRGSPAVGSTLTIDTDSLYDADGAGEISYEWQRRYLSRYVIGPTVGTDSDTYQPTSDDVDFLIMAIVNYTDARGARETVVADYTGRVVPATNPIVVPPADLSIPATGSQTLVDPGTAGAHDNQGGELDALLTKLVSNGVDTPLPSAGSLYLRPGTHLLTWSATDGDGLTGEAVQIVRVDPVVEFHRDRSSPPEGPFGCPLVLNGQPSRYPVSVNYTLHGTLLADDSTSALYEGVIQFDGTEQQATPWLYKDVVGNVADYKSLLLVMDQSANAAMGSKRYCRIFLSDGNFPPRVALQTYQQEVALRIVSKTDGDVSVTSTIDDLDINDTHTYDWSGSDGRLMDIDNRDDTLTFDPAGLDPGLYRIELSVSDGSAIDTAGLSIRVVDEHPTLSDLDSDSDGIPDQDEGVGDSDGDGIPDYLDSTGLPSNILQQEQGRATQYLMETEPGLRLVLGDIAFFAQRHATMITRNDILDYANSGLGAEADAENYPYGGGLFDFRINGIPEPGSSVKVVIPLRQIIEPESVYRKLVSTGWQAFMEDTDNGIRSAQGAAGQCPSPGDAAYTHGMTEGHWCVELTIEDGGPNDADGEANGTITDPGGVTIALSDDNSSGNGGGGAFSLWMLFIMILIGTIRHPASRAMIWLRLVFPTLS